MSPPLGTYSKPRVAGMGTLGGGCHLFATVVLPSVPGPLGYAFMGELVTAIYVQPRRDAVESISGLHASALWRAVNLCPERS